jgi:hypothetical protein
VRIPRIRERAAHNTHPTSSGFRGPDTERIRAFSFPLSISRSLDRITGDGARSLTSCRETASVLADTVLQIFADVAQWAERDHAMVEATSSRLVIRSTSAVPIAGYSRSGFMSRSSRGPGHRDFSPRVSARSSGFDSRTRHQHKEPSSSSRFEGVEIGRNDWAAPEPVTGWIDCFVNSVASLCACTRKGVRQPHGSPQGLPCARAHSAGLFSRKPRVRLPHEAPEH